MDEFRDDFSSEAAANANLKVQLQILSRQKDQAREDARLWQDRASISMEDAHSTQEVLTKQLDEALKHVANVQKRNSILQAERDELKVVLMQKEQDFQDRANSLASAVDQLRVDLDEANRRLSSSRASDEHSFGRNTHTSSSSMMSFQDDMERGDKLRDTERSLRQVKARLLQVEGERDEAHRELDQLLASYSTRRGQLQDRLEQEHLQVQQLWKDNEDLALQLASARDEINICASAGEVQELRDHISLMNEECTHAREQWRLADNKEQQAAETLSRAMATIGGLRAERDALLSATFERQDMHAGGSSRFIAEADVDGAYPASSPEYHATESHSGPPTMRRSSGRDSPLRATSRSRNRSLHRSIAGEDERIGGGGGGSLDASASSPRSGGDGGTPTKKIKSGPSRVLAELVPYFSGGRASLRRRSSKLPKNPVASPDEATTRPGSRLRSSFGQELGSPSAPGSALGYFDEAVDGMISKRSSVGTDVFDAMSQGAASRQSRDLDEIGREMDRLRGECRQKDDLCQEMRQRLESSLKATSGLRDDYDKLLGEARGAMKHIRTLKEKVYDRESPTPDVGLPEKKAQFTEVRLPAEQELGVLLETRMMVSEVVEGLAAYKNGGLQPGDHIMQINGISMVDKTHSAIITALALAKDGCTKLTVLKAGEEFMPSKSMSNGGPAAPMSQSELTPMRGRSQRKSKRWSIRQSVAGIISGRDASAPGDDSNLPPLRRTSSDQHLDQDVLSVKEKFRRRPRRKTTAGLDPESIEAINQVNRLKPAKSTPNFAFIDQSNDFPPPRTNHRTADEGQFDDGEPANAARGAPSRIEDASWLLEQASVPNQASSNANNFAPPPSGRVSPEPYTADGSQAPVAEGIRQVAVHPPPEGSEEAAKGPGLRLKGGCLVGIFVGQVRASGPAGGRFGMRKHDQILSINGKDLQRASLEEAHTAFRPDKNGVIHLSVVQNQLGYETMAVPYDAFYIRCMFSYEPRNFGELGFCVGDVLYVTETVPQRYQQSWLAFHVGSDSVRLLVGSDFIMGAIPNERRAKKYIQSMGGRCHCTGQPGGAPYKRLKEEQVLDQLDMTIREKEDGLDYVQWRGSVARSADSGFPPQALLSPQQSTTQSTTTMDSAVQGSINAASTVAPPPQFGKKPNSRQEADVLLPWPQDVHQELCQALDAEDHGWMLLLEHLERKGVLLSRQRSLRRKSRNRADTLIRRLYGENGAGLANQLLLDWLSSMRFTGLLELLMPYAGLPPVKYSHGQ